MAATPQNPIDPSNFPNPTSGSLSSSETAKLDLLNTLAQKLGVTVEKSYIDAYKKITKIADIFERNIAQMEKKRHDENRRNILTTYKLELDEMRKNHIEADKHVALRKQVLKDLLKEEKQSKERIAKETGNLSRPGYQQLMKKEMGNLPGVGGMISTLQGGGMAALGVTATMAGITALAALIAKFVEAMFKMNIATTRTNVALDKAGVSQGKYGEGLQNAFKQIPLNLVSLEDYAKFTDALSSAPGAIKDIATHGKAFGNFTSGMAGLGVSVEDSIKPIHDASMNWGGTIGQLLSQFKLAKGLTKDTAGGFETIWQTLMDLDPMFKRLTISSQQAADASSELVASVFKQYSAFGMAPTELKGLTEAMADFATSMSPQTMLGFYSLAKGGLPKNMNTFFEQLTGFGGKGGGPGMMTDLWRSGFDKMISQMPKGSEIVGIMAAAQAGQAPAMFADPKMATAMYELIKGPEEGRKSAATSINDYVTSQSKLKINQAAGWETLANLNSPLENLATLLASMLQVLAGPVAGGVTNINNIMTKYANKIGYHSPLLLSTSGRSGAGRNAQEVTMIQEMQNLAKNPRVVAGQSRAQVYGMKDE